jgi:RNA polymerase-binding transcription factor DksA
MNHLRSKQIAQLKDKLDIRMRELREDIRRELAQSENERYREVAGAVADAGDESVANLVADLDAAAIESDVREVRAIEAAFARIKDGTYGVCLGCRLDIPWPRLLVEPAANRCVHCADKYEKSHGRGEVPRL